jgi:ATP-dependent Lon protease
MSPSVLQFCYNLLRESLDRFDKIHSNMKLFSRIVRPALGGIVSLSLLLTGPLAPLAQAKTEEIKSNFWSARKSVSRQRPPALTERAPFLAPPPLRGDGPVKATSKNWFEVASYTPVFGPRSWKRGNVLVPFVTIIQDAHDNYEAQLALSRTLAELAEKEKDGPLLVCVEGAWGPLSTDLFKNPDPEIRRQKADELLKQHVITGEEYLSITRPGLIKLVGVDDPVLHKKNSLARELVETWRRPTTDRIKALQINMERIKKYVYPPRLRALDEIKLKYQTGILSSQEFARKIVPYADKEWWLNNFPHFNRFASLELNGSSNSPTREELEEWVTTLSNTELTKRIDHLFLQKQMDLSALAKELENAPDVLLRMDKRFKLLVELDHWIALTDRLVTLKMTPEDLQKFNRLDPNQTIEDAARKISTIARTNGIRVFPIPKARMSDEGTTWRAAKAFYSIARDRDAAMANNTLREANKHGKRNVVLVAGGFHTPGVTRILRHSQNFNQSLCPLFSTNLKDSPRPSLRKISHFQIGEKSPATRGLVSPHVSGLTTIIRFISLMSIPFLALAADGGTFLEWLQWAVLASTVSDPVLRRLLNSKPIAPPPQEQLINNDTAVSRIAEQLKSRLDSQDIPGAIALLEETSSYSDLRAYYLLWNLNKEIRKTILKNMTPAVKRRIINGLPDFEYHLYTQGIYKILESFSGLKELNILWEEATDQAKVGRLNNNEIISLLRRITTARDSLLKALHILASQKDKLTEIVNTPQAIPTLTPPQEKTDFLLNRVNPALNTRIIAFAEVDKLVRLLDNEEDWLKTKTKALQGLSMFGILNLKKSLGFPPPSTAALGPIIDSIQRANGPEERLRNEYYEIRHPEASHRTIHQDWRRTISIGSRQKTINALGAPPPLTGSEDAHENERIKMIESLSRRIGKEVEDLSLIAQAFLESPEGDKWDLAESIFSKELQSVSDYLAGTVIDRRVTVVLPNASDVRRYAADLAVLYRRQGKAKKLIFLDVARIQTHLGDYNSIESFLTTLMAESRERGDVMLLVDMVGIQGEGNRLYLHLMERWRAENDEHLAPDLILLSNERTSTFYLQQDAIKKTAPPYTVRMKNTDRLTATRLTQIQEKISQHVGIVLGHPIIEGWVAKLTATDRFDVLDRTTRLLMDLSGRALKFKLRGEDRNLENQFKTADQDIEPPMDLPLELRAIARIEDMPPDSRATVRKKLAELTNLRITEPHSQRIPNIERLIEMVVRIPWTEMAPPIVSPASAPEIQDQRIIELYEQLEVKLRRSHTGLGKEAIDALKDLLGRIIQSDIGEAPPSSSITTFLGPPGAGKTALMKLIGDLTGRPVYRISMNLIQDPMSLKGSSPTFLHSKEGRFAAELIAGKPRVGNPIFFCDEIDKTNPAVQAVLLEIGQSSFHDKYIGSVPIGRCIFVATANSLDTVISPLINRMIIVPMPGYTLDEKTAIAARHTLPRALAGNYLSDDPGSGHQEVAFKHRAEVLQFIARGYAREEGMRGMIRKIDDLLIQAYAQFIKTGKPTLIDTKFVRSALGMPVELLRIPRQDPVGRAYFPHSSGNLIDVHVGARSQRSPLAGRPAFQEMASLVELLIRERGDAWTQQVHGLFGVPSPTIVGLSDLQIDVPRMVQEEAVAQLAMTIATLSKATGVGVKREVALVGELNVRGELEEASRLRQRVLVAYDAGARWMVMPHRNREELMTKLFPAIPAIRGPILAPPAQNAGDWTVLIPLPGDNSYSSAKGTRESVLAIAEENLQRNPTGCLYVLARTVEDTLPFAFAKPGRPDFKEIVPSLIDTGPPVEAERIEEHQTPDSIIKPLEPVSRDLEWRIDVKGQSIDLRRLFFNGLTEQALTLMREIADTVSSTGSQESIAQLEACARFAIAHRQGAAVVDLLLGLDGATRHRIVSNFSPETLGTLVHLKRASGYQSATKQWAASLFKIQTASEQIEKKTFARETAIEVQGILSVPGLFPPLAKEDGSYYSILGLRRAIDDFLYRDGELNNVKDHLDETLKVGIVCLNRYKQPLSYSSTPETLARIKNALDQLYTELAIFRPLFFGADQNGGPSPKESWDIYTANELLRQEILSGSCRFIPLSDLPSKGEADPIDSDVWQALFRSPFERFIEVINRDNHRVMVLTGCPPLLRNAWVHYLNRNLWKEGLPRRIIKIDVSTILQNETRYLEGSESKWSRLQKTLETARDSGDVVVWIDLDFLPVDTPPFLISRLIRAFDHGSGRASFILTGEEFTHQNFVESSPVYAQGVVHQSLREENRENLLRLEIIEREKLAGLPYPAPVVNHLCAKVGSGEISLSLARRILDRVTPSPGSPLTPALMDSTQKIIELENDQSLQWATLWEQYEHVSGQIPKPTQQRALTLLGQYRKASGDEAASIENQIRIIIDFPWGKRTQSSIPPVSSPPQASDYEALHNFMAAQMEAVKKELDLSHHGMGIAKDKVIHHVVRDSLARSHTGKGVGKPLLVVSHPGQGKTTLAESVARALGRPFISIPLGAIEHPEELTGFASQYVNSDAGLLVKGMIRAGVLNPVMLLDEIDKMAKGEKNSIESILSITDPEQNARFRCEYTQVDYPLDEVVFFATANDIRKIPQPVLDRFDVVVLAPYTEQEKSAILVDKALPELMKGWDVNGRVKVTEAPQIAQLILGTVKEHGVRLAKAQLSKLILRALIESHLTQKTIELTKEVAQRLLGFLDSSPDTETITARVGEINGLVFNESTGEGAVLEILANLHNIGGSDPFNYSGFGRLGSSMSSSLDRAVSLAQKRAREIEPTLNLDGTFLSVLLTQQDVPKDGDSAGVGFYFVVLSALTKIPVRRDIAITGAISPSEGAMRVGAIEAKVSAAMNAGARSVFLPAEGRDTVDAMVRTNGTTLSLIEDLSEHEYPCILRIPSLLWKPGTEKQSQELLVSSVEKEGMTRDQISFENGVAVIRCNVEQMNKFFQTNENYSKPPVFVLYSDINQIEDRVLDRNGPRGTDGGLPVPPNGFLNIPLAITLFAICALSLGFPIWVEIAPIVHWATTHVWFIILSVPVLVLSAFTPLIISRIIGQKGSDTPGSTRESDGFVHLNEMETWKVMVALNNLAENTTDNEILSALKEAVSQVDSNRPINAKDPLWINLYPHLKHGPGSHSRRPLTDLLAQANPDLNQIEMIIPATQSTHLPTSRLLKTLRNHLIQT